MLQTEGVFTSLRLDSDRPTPSTEGRGVHLLDQAGNYLEVITRPYLQTKDTSALPSLSVADGPEEDRDAYAAIGSLNVDGILNPHAAPARPPDYTELELFPGEQVRINSQRGPMLLQLAERFDLIWATSWNHEANRLFAPLLALPTFPWPCFLTTTAATATSSPPSKPRSMTVHVSGSTTSTVRLLKRGPRVVRCRRS